ncbi:MAG: DMT family transporter [Clostridiales bacterium]|nr:DMT family transporter [Clostridiales bacterium]
MIFLESDKLNKKTLIGNAFLLLTAIIWGSAFVAQRVGMDYVGPLKFVAVRFWLAVLTLLPIVYLTNLGGKNTEQSPEEYIQSKKPLRIAGFTCGTVLFIASTLQQFGLVFTSAGKTGFITALYIVLVPIFGLFLKQKIGIKCWVGVAFGTVGIYFLTLTESLTIQPGDLVVLIGAAFWAIHVLVIDHFNPYVNAAKLSLMQFAVCATYGTIAMLIFERPSLGSIFNAAIPILYAGVLSAGVGFTLQILGQKNTSPTVASLLLSMEAVFAVIFGFILLKETMSSRELLGCILMFIAIIISQLPSKSVAEPSET